MMSPNHTEHILQKVAESLNRMQGENAIYLERVKNLDDYNKNPDESLEYEMTQAIVEQTGGTDLDYRGNLYMEKNGELVPLRSYEKQKAVEIDGIVCLEIKDQEILIVVEAKHQARNRQIKILTERITSIQGYLTSLNSVEASSDRITKQQDRIKLRKQEGILKFYSNYRVMGALCAVGWENDVMQKAHDKGLWTCIATGSRITVNKHKTLNIP